jgi:predicted nucleic acid-binding protein
VILPDVNLLVYAADETARNHERALEWVETTLSGTETVAFAWLGQPAVTVVHPTDRHAAALRDLLVPLGTAGNLTSDAHLAALAIEHGATLYSADVDFSRFPGLRWVDPLSA